MSSARIDRRTLLRYGVGCGGVLALDALLPAWASSESHGLPPSASTLTGPKVELTIGHTPLRIGGKAAHAVTVNGTLPAPLVRLRQGERARIAVTNELDEVTSIHWHGVILPFQMDGVPGVSFPGIPPRSTFVYEFDVVQAGTYWYHSHSGLQEQMGHYGPLVIDPFGRDPIACDREYAVVLSDWSALHAHAIFRKLKQQPGYFNRRRQTLAGLLAGEDQPLAERFAWAGMRMDPTDISDVTGSAYTFLVNGHAPADNWTALFTPGERVRLRFVNASAMTNFHVRIPGLRMSVVQGDGQNVRPVEVEELSIAVAETYDVVVVPRADRAYTLVAEAVDRSGLARATLAPRPGMTAEVPPLRARPVLGMKDMGMDMSGMDHAHHEMDMSMRNPANAPQVALGPGVQMISPMPADRTGEVWPGLEDAGHRVLVYRDLVALARNPDVRTPSRELEIHLTGNMERFMWSFDGEKYSEITAPIPFQLGERVRVTLVNDSMMAHPIHLHGHFFELVTGHGEFAPRKHTVNVLPGAKLTFDVTADAPGDWAFHCHLLYHMHAGMFRVVSVRPLPAEPA